MRQTILLLCTLLCLLIMPAMAQEQTEEPTEEQETALFVSSSDPAFSFIYPAVWTAEEDSPTTFYLQGGEVTVLVEVITALDDPFIISALENDEPTEPVDILDHYFGEFESPEIIELANTDEKTDAAIDEDESEETINPPAVVRMEQETIFAISLDPDYFALLFVSGEEDAREEAEPDLVLILSTLMQGVPETTETTAETTPQAPVFTGDMATISTEIAEGGSISMSYPADLIADVFDNTIYIQDDDGEVFILLTADRSFGMDLIGGEGNPDLLNTPRGFLEAIMSYEDVDFNVDDLIEDTQVRGMEAAIIDLSDTISTTQIAVIEVAPDTLVLFMLYMPPEQSAASMQSVLDSITYTP